ncbi:putative nrps-like enzyme protein [Botrytis fragariae]|uniref:Putative nrps-like enzyme protein n=1 Tax=Botrytis fragariae TaxID=1964551 RepID=A0A8H6AIM2_9HELO|nr:putative nrps-like enzyme protein [Botrytis fragariae]KAF5867965.1 putative nrps-like enzyme protein [Botrytis fragariae]
MPSRVEQTSQTLVPAKNYLEDLIQTYSRCFPVRKAKTIIKSHGDGLGVILTGSTSYLGYYLLKALIADSKVARIVRLNRSEADKDFSAGFGDLDGAQKVQFVKASFGEPRFGLEPAIHRSCPEIINAILHNTWSVDFNLRIESFEKVHIAGVRNFIDRSLLSPRKVTIQFVSLLGSLANWPPFRPKKSVSEQIITSSNLPMLGYGDTREGLTTFNPIKPSFVKWSDLVLGVKQILGVTKEVSLQNWLKEREKHDATSRDEVKKFPALKLLGFFEWVANEKRLIMITRIAQVASPS